MADEPVNDPRLTGDRIAGLLDFYTLSPTATPCKRMDEVRLALLELQERRAADKTGSSLSQSELYESSQVFRHVWVCPLGWIGDKLIYGPGYDVADIKQWIIELRRLVGFENPQDVQLNAQKAAEPTDSASTPEQKTCSPDPSPSQ